MRRSGNLDAFTAVLFAGLIFGLSNRRIQVRRRNALWKRWNRPHVDRVPYFISQVLLLYAIGIARVARWYFLRD